MSIVPLILNWVSGGAVNPASVRGQPRTGWGVSSKGTILQGFERHLWHVKFKHRHRFIHKLNISQEGSHIQGLCMCQSFSLSVCSGYLFFWNTVVFTNIFYLLVDVEHTSGDTVGSHQWQQEFPGSYCTVYCAYVIFLFYFNIKTS